MVVGDLRPDVLGPIDQRAGSRGKRQAHPLPGAVRARRSGAGGELSGGKIQRELLRSVRDCDHSELRSLLRRRRRKGSKNCNGVVATDPQPFLAARGLARCSQNSVIWTLPRASAATLAAVFHSRSWDTHALVLTARTTASRGCWRSPSTPALFQSFLRP